MTYRPWTSRSVGVEMELNTQTTTHARLTQEHLANAMRPALAGIPNARPVLQHGYTHSNGRSWDVKTDGSCGWEIASPALRLDDEGDNAELKAVCEAVGALSPQINRSCGLHVHVDVSDFSWDDLRRLVTLWTRYEPFFFGLTPPSRRTNTYCAPMRKAEWVAPNSRMWPSVERGIEARNANAFRDVMSGMPRYLALNLTPFWSSGRVEFRLHSGTINYVKIRNWVKLMVTIVQRAKNPDMPKVAKVTAATRDTPFNTYYVCKVLGLIRSRYVPDVPASNDAFVAWIEARRRQFDPSARPMQRSRRDAAQNVVDANETREGY